MPISEIVDVNITAQSLSVTRAGFGTPLLMAYHNVFADVVRYYTDTSEMISDGFPSYHPAVKMAEALKSQSPSPEGWKVGKLPAPSAPFKCSFTVDAGVTEGDTVSVQVVDPTTGLVTTASYTLAAAETATTAATAIAAILNALPGMSAAGVAAVVTITAANNGEIVFTRSPTKGVVATLDPTTPWDYGAAIDTIRLTDDDWYGVDISYPSEDNLDNVIAKVEALTKIGAFAYPGTATGFIAWLAGHTSEDRSHVAYCSGEKLEDYPGCGIMGVMLPKDPGSATWFGKTIAGLEPDTVSSSNKASILAAGGNTYTRIAGRNVTQNGTALSGEFMDITRFVDWLTARIGERVFGLIVSLDKVAYDDEDIDLIRAEIDAQLGLGIDAKGLKSDPAPIVIMPKASEVNALDRAARLLPNVKFSGYLAGAVHKVQVNGTLSI